MIAERIEAPSLRLLDLASGQTCRSFSTRFEGELSCVKTGLFNSQYEIHAGDRCIGALRLSGLFRPTVNATTNDGAWFFEPGERSVVVRSQHPLRDLATVDLSFSDHGGILRFPDGRALIFSSDFWKGRAEFQTPSGDPVVRFRFHGMFRPSAGIDVLEGGKRLPELSWLLMLGWSLIVGYL
jgi:hypothetical protein